MSEPFDPYYKWLAIPPAEQPPNFYRLLAVPLFTDDADVIANAADQRMAYVRSLQGNQHVQRSQRLLNEISAARICLLQAEKKQAYDAELRARLATVPIPVQASVPLPIPPPVEPLPPPRILATRIEATPPIVTNQVSPRVVAPKRQRGPLGIMIAALGGVSLFLGSLIILLLPSWQTVAKPDPTRPNEQSQRSDKSVASKIINEPNVVSQVLTEPTPPKSKPASVTNTPTIQSVTPPVEHVISPPAVAGPVGERPIEKPEQLLPSAEGRRIKAIAEGDLFAALQAAQELARLQHRDGLESKLAVIAELRPYATSPAQNELLAGSLLDLLEQACRENRYDLAEREMGQALLLARQSSLPAVIRRAVKLILLVRAKRGDS